MGKTPPVVASGIGMGSCGLMMGSLLERRAHRCFRIERGEQACISSPRHDHDRLSTDCAEESNPSLSLMLNGGSGILDGCTR
jgi:hypothetical protein